MRLKAVPCDIDDTIYLIDYGRIRKLSVEGIVIEKDSGYISCKIKSLYKRIPFSEFGKTAFLSKETAQEVFEQIQLNKPKPEGDESV